MGYGPLVRATTGVSRLWTSGEPADPGFYDATTIFPDHVVARITAIAALAALINRDATGVGAHVHISQAEAAVNQLATSYVTEAARADGLAVGRRRRGPRRLPVCGRRRVVRDLGAIRRRPRRSGQGHRDRPNYQPTEREFVAAVSAWTAAGTRARSSPRLQDAGCACGPDEPSGRRARRPAGDVPPALRRHGASAVRRADAPPRRIPRPTATSPTRRCGPPRCRASTPARSAASTARPGRRRDRPPDRRGRAVRLVRSRRFDGRARHDVHRPQNARARRLRPGQPARRRPERRARRPDGAGRPRRRRSPGPRGRRLGAHRQPAVVAVPQPRTACSRNASARPHAESRYTGIGGNVPQSLVNQACLDIQRGQRRHGADRGRRVAGAPGPKVRAGGGKLDWTKQDDSVPVPHGADDEFVMAGPVELTIHLDRPAYVYPMFEQALRIAAGETSDGAPPSHRRAVGAVQRRGTAQSARLEPGPGVGRGDLAAGPRQPDDQLAVHQADELQQHGRPGRGADPDVGGEGDASSDPHGPVGVPVRGHRRARHLPDRRARRVRPLARHPDRGPPGTRAGGHRHRRRRPGRRVLVLPVGRPGRGRRTRPPAGRPRPAADGHRRSDVRGRAVEQLRVALDRHDGRAAGGCARQRRASSPPTAATSPSTASASTAPSRRAHEFRWEDVQSAVDAEPTRVAEEEWTGVGTVETWTTPFTREGAPEKVFLAVRTPDDTRALAVLDRRRPRPRPARARTSRGQGSGARRRDAPGSCSYLMV